MVEGNDAAKGREPKTAEHAPEYYIEKHQHIVRTYETAWSCVDRLDTRSQSIRQWSIALVVAYVGFMATMHHDLGPMEMFWLAAALTFAICVFGYLDWTARVLFRFYFETATHIDDLFRADNPQAFENRVATEYKEFNIGDRFKEKETTGKYRYRRATLKGSWPEFIGLLVVLLIVIWSPVVYSLYRSDSMSPFDWYVFGLAGSGIAGGVLGGLLVLRYFWGVGGELRAELEKIRKFRDQVIRAMKEAGLAEFTYDECGEPSGLRINPEGNVGQVRGDRPA